MKKLIRVSKTKFVEAHTVALGADGAWAEVGTQFAKADSAWLLTQLTTYTTRMVETAAKKNADYAGASPEPFANFSHVESLGIATTEQGFLTRMTDKLCRIATFAKKGVLQVSDESVEDTLLDLANYSLLMASYIKAKKAGML